MAVIASVDALSLVPEFNASSDVRHVELIGACNSSCIAAAVEGFHAENRPSVIDEKALIQAHRLSSHAVGWRELTSLNSQRLFADLGSDQLS